MTDTPTRDQNKFIVRMPDGMREEFRKAAEVSGRSMNAEIVHRLNSTLEYDFNGAEHYKLMLEESQRDYRNHLVVSKVFCLAIMGFQDSIPQEVYSIAEQMFDLYDRKADKDFSEADRLRYLQFVARVDDAENDD